MKFDIKFVTFLFIAFVVGFLAGRMPKKMANAYYRADEAVLVEPTQESLELRNRSDTEQVQFLYENILEEMVMCVTPSGERVYHKFCRNSNSCEKDAREYANYFFYAGYKNNVDPWLLAAVVRKETQFDAYKVGGVGERTLFQLHPKAPWGRKSKFVRSRWYRTLCKKEAGHCQKRPADIAAALLRDHFDSVGLERGLTMYNTGKGTYVRRKYVKPILKFRNILMNPNKFKICSSGRNRV